MKRKHLLSTAVAGLAAVGLLAGCAGQPAEADGDAAVADAGYELAGGDNTLQLLVIGDAAPFASVNDDGDYEGFDVALLTEVTERLDLDLEIRSQEFDTILPTVAIGQADAAASSIADTDERRETVTFSLPTYTGVMSVTVREDSDIADENDLPGRKVGVISGSRNAEYAEQYFTESELIYFPAESPLFNALQSSTIDAAFFDGQVADKYVQQYDVKIVFSGVNDDNRGAAIVLNQDAEKLRQDINATLREILDDGTYQEIFETWVTTESVEPQLDFLTKYYAEHPSDDYPNE
ncbi:ABC transporter substrate-binding protein [Agromyces sp. Marseille-P2726]|uniref:ABC transporter substrate-binding protein n=1 Tax=Agromyces sp. Marseille-P2726 TaxID=2709132 RepID=UPI00156DF66A|nr:ABC transporter substrate-binding protein [Agromyces sp. Marseille-P2726]